MSRFLVVLVPARNAAGDLPGLFGSIRGLADAVVALDDGSTDGTREVLAAEPLVEVLLTNRRRENYRGWDDAANRNRLLEAAAALEPEWILSLDADERIDQSAEVVIAEPREENSRFQVFKQQALRTSRVRHVSFANGHDASPCCACRAESAGATCHEITSGARGAVYHEAVVACVQAVGSTCMYGTFKVCTMGMHKQ